MLNKQKNEETIFKAAAKLRTSAERMAYVKDVCGDDSELLTRVVSLLRVHSTKNNVLDVLNPDVDVALDRPPLSEGPGTVIGRYKLLEQIGEGGFGVVWTAEQKQPVKRRVALKIIKQGMDTKQVVTRFEAERQALALMEHPSIAKVLDGGSTETGRPYFVMELVRGIPIVEYCDQQKLPTANRLDLVIKVCHAIQHAHQKGIIHRDIKPSNILITSHDGIPVPKVIDFGIAKATQHELTEKTVYTQFQQFIGTPAYMSPEQAEMSGLDIDTRSDLYSLGVLLYELLTGSTPFDTDELLRSGLDEMRKIIREREPSRPSSKFAMLSNEARTKTALCHATESPRLISILRGDLDWVVMKCLEKDRTRRYETANGLAMDLQRHLENQPVVARPPSRLYRLEKAWRRNKLVCTAVAAVAALGTLVSVWQAVRATQASQREHLAHQETASALDAARQSERLAKDEALTARRNLYASDMHLAQQALEANDTGRARWLLERHISSPNRTESNDTSDVSEDLRGWEWRYLWAQLRNGKYRVFATLPQAVFGLDVSPDGRYLAASTVSGLLKLWELPSGDEVATIEPGADLPTKPVFFPDSDRLVYHYWTSQSTNGLLKIWNLQTQKVSREIPYPTLIGPKAVSPNGQQILFGALPGSVRLFDLRTGLTPWKVNRLAGTSMHNSDSFLFAEPDGKEWILGDVNGDIRVFDVETGQPITYWKAHSGSIFALKMSRDGRLLASGSVSIKVWNYQTHELLGELKGHRSWVGDVEFTSDGRRLVSSSADQTVRLWDLKTFTELATFRGADQEVWEIESLSDDRTIYSGAKNGKIYVWDATDRPRELSPEVARDVDRFALSPSGDRLAVLSTDHSVKTAVVGDAISLVAADYAGTDNSFVNLSPDGNQLIAGKTDGGIVVYSITTGERLYSSHVRHAGITRVRMLASGNRLLSSDRERNLLLQNIGTGKPEVVWTVKMKDWETFFPSQTFAVPSDERTVAVGSFSGRVTLWDLSTGREIDSFQNPSPQPIIYGLAFSPDGQTLATADVYGAIRLWDTANRHPVADLQGYAPLTFSSDGKRLVSSGGDAMIIWDVVTRQELLRFHLDGGVSQIAFSPNGNRLFVLNAGTRALCAWGAPPAPP